MTDAITISVPISKVDDEKRLVFGWASIVEDNGNLVIDRQDDVIRPEEMEKAVYDYNVASRTANTDHMGGEKAVLVESIFFSAEKQASLGIDLKKQGWWVGYRVTDEEAWAGVKSGRYKAFSIEGASTRKALK